MKQSIALGLTMSLLIVLARAENPEHWPAWRGTNGNGIAPADAQPPIKWDEKNNIQWKVELPGKGSATPVVWGDQVFVLTATPTQREAKPEELPPRDTRFETKTQAPTRFYQFEVLSFDRTTGKVRWRQIANEAVPHEGHHPTHSYAAGSPATDGKRLYVSFGSFGTYAYDLTGKLLWKRDLGRLHTRLGWGEAVTPVVYGDSVILNLDQETDSRLVALDASTGNIRWEVKRDEKTSWNTPIVVKHGDSVQIIVNGTNRVRSYDLATGKPIWEVSGMTTNAIPSPLTHGGFAYVTSGYRGAAALAIPLDSKGDLGDGTGKVAWKYSKGTPYVPSPLLLNGRLYMTKGNTQLLTVLDAKSGKPILEDERLPKATSFYASPAAANGHVYLVDRNGTTVVLKDGDKPLVVSINSLNDPIDASPVFSGKTLFLRGEKYLYAIAGSN